MKDIGLKDMIAGAVVVTYVVWSILIGGIY
jgi:hypothetical protein